jgi:hypothetical protein
MGAGRTEPVARCRIDGRGRNVNAPLAGSLTVDKPARNSSFNFRSPLAQPFARG